MARRSARARRTARQHRRQRQRLRFLTRWQGDGFRTWRTLELLHGVPLRLAPLFGRIEGVRFVVAR